MRLPVRLFQVENVAPPARPGPPAEVAGFDAEGRDEDAAREAARKALTDSGWVVRALSFSPTTTGLGLVAYVHKKG